MSKKNRVNTPHTNSGNDPDGRTFSVVPHSPSSGSSTSGRGSGKSSKSDTSSTLHPLVQEQIDKTQAQIDAAANVIRNG
ncbi:hypothetical protein BKA00_003941 [Actinomadura coerulea]|uniref:Uncharacterized protein n=1 Tax=Actinomadura coerulea TaxID=46159 RepID=A0A7X0G1G3_9ACTN|nr:hypothetical protein [Actinomadura coerulea]MBB6397027.1 hypothetical protein [Actinomadura coerulea]GGP96109.1 hypothetical protein GCM10010187_09700 [Actinomadura coerulea]